MGAYIPGWLLASILGIIMAGLSKVVLSHLGLHDKLMLPILVYISLAFLWSGFIWMLLFQS